MAGPLFILAAEGQRKKANKRIRLAPSVPKLTPEWEWDDDGREWVWVRGEPYKMKSVSMALHGENESRTEDHLTRKTSNMAYKVTAQVRSLVRDELFNPLFTLVDRPWFEVERRDRRDRKAASMRLARRGR